MEILLSILLILQSAISPGRGTGKSAASGATCSPTLPYVTNLALRHLASDFSTCTGAAVTSQPAASGTSVTATLTGATCIATGGPGGGKALALNGSASKAVLSAPVVGGQNTTVFVVFYLTATTKGKFTGITSGSGTFGYYAGNGTNTIQGADKSATVNLGDGTTVIPQNTWHQINVSYDGTTVTFRANSASDGSATQATTITAAIDQLYNDSGTELYAGRIAEIDIFNEAMTLTNRQLIEANIRACYGVS